MKETRFVRVGRQTSQLLDLDIQGNLLLLDWDNVPSWLEVPERDYWISYVKDPDGELVVVNKSWVDIPGVRPAFQPAADELPVCFLRGFPTGTRVTRRVFEPDKGDKENESSLDE